MLHTPRIVEFLSTNNWQNTPDGLIISLVHALVNDVTDYCSTTEEKLKMIASLRGIQPEPIYRDMPEGDSGCIVIKKGRRFIQINKKISRGRQIFTWAHEICHTFFPSQNNDAEDQYEERLCDIGASEMIFCNVDLSQFSFCIKDLTTVANLVGASLEATAIFLVKSPLGVNKGMAVWKKRLKYPYDPDQILISSDIPKRISPRTEYAYFDKFTVVIPKNKPVKMGAVIPHAFFNNAICQGNILLELDEDFVLNTEAIKTSEDRVLTLFTGFTILKKKSYSDAKEPLDFEGVKYY